MYTYIHTYIPWLSRLTLNLLNMYVCMYASMHGSCRSEGEPVNIQQHDIQQGYTVVGTYYIRTYVSYIMQCMYIYFTRDVHLLYILKNILFSHQYYLLLFFSKFFIFSCSSKNDAVNVKKSLLWNIMMLLKLYVLLQVIDYWTCKQREFFEIYPKNNRSFTATSRRFVFDYSVGCPLLPSIKQLIFNIFDRFLVGVIISKVRVVFLYITFLFILSIF